MLSLFLPVCMLQHAESNRKINEASVDLRNEIEELKELRRGLISNTSLDSQVDRMQE